MKTFSHNVPADFIESHAQMFADFINSADDTEAHDIWKEITSEWEAYRRIFEIDDD